MNKFNHFLLALLLAVPFQPSFAAEDDAAGVIAEISSKDTSVKDIQVTNGSKVFRVGVGDSLQPSDQVKTPAGVSVTITLTDDSQITLGPNSDIQIKEILSKTSGTTVRMISGYLHLLIKKVYTDEKPFVVETKTTAMGVRGTEFVVDDKDGKTSIHTLEGQVAFAKSREALVKTGGFELVGAGFKSQFQQGGNRPTKPAAFERAQFMKQMQMRSPQFAQMSQAAHRREGFQQQLKRMEQGGPKGPGQQNKPQGGPNPGGNQTGQPPGPGQGGPNPGSPNPGGPNQGGPNPGGPNGGPPQGGNPNGQPPGPGQGGPPNPDGGPPPDGAPNNRSQQQGQTGESGDGSEGGRQHGGPRRHSEGGEHQGPHRGGLDPRAMQGVQMNKAGGGYKPIQNFGSGPQQGNRFGNPKGGMQQPGFGQQMRPQGPGNKPMGPPQPGGPPPPGGNPPPGGPPLPGGNPPPPPPPGPTPPQPTPTGP